MTNYCYDFEYIGLRFVPDFISKLPDEVYLHLPAGARFHAEHITCLHCTQMQQEGAANVLINFIEDVVVKRSYMVEVKFTHIGISAKAHLRSVRYYPQYRRTVETLDIDEDGTSGTGYDETGYFSYNIKTEIA